MKKQLVIVITIFLVMLSGINFAHAEVFYNNDTNEYVSTDESDGVLSFGGSVYKSNGELFGLSKEDGPYLQNIVPSNESTLVTTSVTNDSKYISLSKTESKKNTVFNYKYRPNKKRFVFKWKKTDNNNIGTVNIDVLEAKTGKIVARGYNLKGNQLYKTAVDVENVPLQIQLTSNDSENGKLELVMGSSSSIDAEKKEYPFAQENLVNANSITGLVPKNIDGNQGKILASYTITGLGNRMLRTAFSGSTNNMSTINMAYEYYGMPIDYVLNLPLYSYFQPAVSFGTGYRIDLKLSTNSNQGTATLNFYERSY